MRALCIGQIFNTGPLHLVSFAFARQRATLQVLTCMSIYDKPSICITLAIVRLSKLANINFIIFLSFFFYFFYSCASALDSLRFRSLRSSLSLSLPRLSFSFIKEHPPATIVKLLNHVARCLGDSPSMASTCLPMFNIVSIEIPKYVGFKTSSIIVP